jgi:dihydroorotate dehydrogenase (NAD+) catalytic subunit
VEYFLAGARAIQAGTANFYDPRALVYIRDGLEEFLKKKGMKSMNELIGQMKQ